MFSVSWQGGERGSSRRASSLLRRAHAYVENIGRPGMQIEDTIR